MTGHARKGHWIAIAAVVLSGLAALGPYALAEIDSKQKGLATAIAIPAAAVFFGALIWLGRQR